VDTETLFYQLINQFQALNVGNMAAPAQIQPGAQAAAGPAIPAPEVPNNLQFLKIPLPEIFYGQRDALIIQAWMFQFNQYCRFYRMTDEQKQSMVPSYLRGEAGLWWQNRISEVAAGRLPALANWAAFEQALQEEFEPKEYQFELRSKWNKYYQNNRSVQEYITEFRKITILMKDTTPYEVLHHFITHLRSDLAKEVMKQRPRTLQEAETAAQFIEDIDRRHGGKQKDTPAQPKQEKKKTTPTPANPYAQYPVYPGYQGYNPYNGVAPMELDNINAKGKAPAKPNDKGKGKII
jgi:Retrotransposon gag protein